MMLLIALVAIMTIALTLSLIIVVVVMLMMMMLVLLNRKYQKFKLMLIKFVVINFRAGMHSMYAHCAKCTIFMTKFNKSNKHYHRITIRLIVIARRTSNVNFIRMLPIIILLQ